MPNRPSPLPAPPPEVDDAAGYAVQQLSEQSNSLFPYTLKRVSPACLCPCSPTPLGG